MTSTNETVLPQACGRLRMILAHRACGLHAECRGQADINQMPPDTHHQNYCQLGIAFTLNFQHDRFSATTPLMLKEEEVSVRKDPLDSAAYPELARPLWKHRQWGPTVWTCWQVQKIEHSSLRSLLLKGGCWDCWIEQHLSPSCNMHTAHMSPDTILYHTLSLLNKSHYKPSLAKIWLCNILKKADWTEPARWAECRPLLTAFYNNNFKQVIRAQIALQREVNGVPLQNGNNTGKTKVTTFIASFRQSHCILKLAECKSEFDKRFTPSGISLIWAFLVNSWSQAPKERCCRQEYETL